MNKYHLSLKESLLILKLKPSLNVTKEPIPLYLFDNDSEYYYYYYYYIQGSEIQVHVHSCAPKASIRYTKMCAPKNVIIFIYTLKSLSFCFHKNNVICIFEENKIKLIKPQGFLTNL